MAKKIKKYIYSKEDSAFCNGDAGFLATAYPSEIKEALDSLKQSIEHPQCDPELTQIEFILNRLESEAKKVLISSGYPTDLADLWWTEDHKMDMQAASAKQVLFSALNVRDDIADNRTEQVALDMLLLISSAIKAEVFDLVLDGWSVKKGRARPKPKRRLRGIELAINSYLEERESRGPEQIWNKLKIAGWETESDEITYEIFIDGGDIYQVTRSSKGEISKHITKVTFNDYVKRIKKDRKKSVVSK
ncbi:MAG: hypothetical protein JRI48_08400 [Deltaproteobacteria bacterium]|nr:hypothetical protein [Deltaproteobacteria bacterium]